MKACLGTTNPSKVAGISRALSLVFGQVEVVSLRVVTSIPPQPICLQVVIEGARRRALGALSALPDCDVGVGLEAGLYALNGRFYDVQVAYIATREGRESLGLSPSFEIPEAFARAIVLGEARELEEVADKVFGTVDIGCRGGLVKMLTRSLVNREDLAYYATLMALIPLINEDLYRGREASSRRTSSAGTPCPSCT